MASEPRPIITPEQIRFLHDNGYVAIEALLTADEVARYRELYDRFLDDRIDSRGMRNNALNTKNDVFWLSWPSYLIPILVDAPLHRKAVEISRAALGDDMIFDFDMMIDKPPHVNKPTAWHHDASYWPDQSDLRAVSVWVALDDVDVDNGCMWFVPKSHQQDISLQRIGDIKNHSEWEAKGVPCPLKPGGATLHLGRTLHYSRGNTTDRHRRAFVVNTRPAKMVEYERSIGWDHGLSKALEAELGQRDRI